MILQCGKAESGWARAAFGGNRRFGRLGESQPPATSSFAGASGRLQLGAAFEPPGSLGGKQSGPQIQNDSFNKYDFSFYIWI